MWYTGAMYDVKRRGPRTEPWGTPVVTDALLDETPLTKTDWDWSKNLEFKPVQSPITDSKLVGRISNGRIGGTHVALHV
jgi:hypothetical protein